MSNDNPAFKEEPLSEFDHIDPDKHWIGESLPSPSLAEVTYAGAATATGTSPFPARADHSHDTRTIKAVYNMSGGAKTITAGGNTFIDGLTLVGGDDLLHSGSTQLLDFPQEGVWDIHVRYVINRASSTFPANIFHEFRVYYSNGGVARALNVHQMNEGRTQFATTATDIVWYSTITSASNVQFWCNNPDAVNWTFQFGSVTVLRRCSAQGVEIV